MKQHEKKQQMRDSKIGVIRGNKNAQKDGVNLGYVLLLQRKALANTSPQSYQPLFKYPK